MKNVILGVIFSFFVTAGSIASVSSGLNLPGDKKKKCCKENKECKEATKPEGKEKKCCTSKGDGKECSKKKE